MNLTCRVRLLQNESFYDFSPNKGDSTLKSEQSPQNTNLLQNDSEVGKPIYQEKEMKLKSVSNAPKIDFKTLSKSQKYKFITSTENTPQNGSNFITLGKISEDERIEIIQKGFQLQAQEIISLKKYYESTSPDSLFQWKGYSIKYESIRRRPLFKQLKP